MYRCSAIPIKTLTQLFIDVKRKIFNFIWKCKKLRITKIILFNKGTSGGITMPDFKLYYKNIVIKQFDIGIKTDMWINEIKSKDSDINSYI